MDVHPTAVVLLQSRIFLLEPPKPPPTIPPATASRGRLCCCTGFTGPPYPQTPSRPFLYSPRPPIILRRRQPHTIAEPVNPRTPLRMGIPCLVFLGSASFPYQASPSSTALVLSTRHGQRCQRTTAIRRRLYTVRLTGGPTSYIFARKEVHLYYGQKN